MQHQEFEPPSVLRDTIKCFWYNSREFGEQTSGFEVIPDGYAEIIFHFGSGCSIANNVSLQPLPSPFMVGLLNQPAIFYAKNRLEIIAIRCFPWTVFDLLGLSPGKDSIRIFDHPIAQLQTALEECIGSGNINKAVAIIKQYFVNAHTQIAAESMLFKAGVAMQKAKGALPVNQVAKAAYATVRTLQRNFKTSSGHTVKNVSALMRFEQVRNQLWLNPNVNLAGLAAESGYTDQAHLIKEFKRFSGSTPGTFARKAKKEKTAVNFFENTFVKS